MIQVASKLGDINNQNGSKQKENADKVTWSC